MARESRTVTDAGGAEALQRVVQRTSSEFDRLLAAPLESGLYLVATPIGNLADITLRALSILARADVVYCEDTRHSARLLQHFGIRAETRPFHEHNEDEVRERILSALSRGGRIAVISDAGTPLISDPGYKLVREASAAGSHVVAAPGPSAVLAALVVSGLPTDAFFFAGFLPPRQSARRRRIEELQNVPGSLVFYEAPQRLSEALADLAAVLGQRPAAVARELTKLHEEAVRADLPTLARDYAGLDVKGEIVIVVGPPVRAAVGDDEIADMLTRVLETSRLADASGAVAEALQVPRSRVYDIGLRLKRARDEQR